jgi:hypothetical protein
LIGLKNYFIVPSDIDSGFKLFSDNQRWFGNIDFALLSYGQVFWYLSQCLPDLPGSIGILFPEDETECIAVARLPMFPEQIFPARSDQGRRVDFFSRLHPRYEVLLIPFHGLQ